MDQHQHTDLAHGPAPVDAEDAAPLPSPVPNKIGSGGSQGSAAEGAPRIGGPPRSPNNLPGDDGVAAGTEGVERATAGDHPCRLPSRTPGQTEPAVPCQGDHDEVLWLQLLDEIAANR